MDFEESVTRMQMRMNDTGLKEENGFFGDAVTFYFPQKPKLLQLCSKLN